MKAFLAILVLAGGAWFFFQAQNQVSDWRTDVDKKREQMVDGSKEWDAISDRSGIVISFSSGFERLLDLNARMLAINDRLINLLKNKPYGLPLSIDETERLNRAIKDRNTLMAATKRLTEGAKKENAHLEEKAAAETAQSHPALQSLFPPGVETPEQRREYLLALAEAKKNVHPTPVPQATPVRRYRDKGY